MNILVSGISFWEHQALKAISPLIAITQMYLKMGDPNISEQRNLQSMLKTTG